MSQNEFCAAMPRERAFSALTRRLPLDGIEIAHLSGSSVIDVVVKCKPRPVFPELKIKGRINLVEDEATTRIVLSIIDPFSIIWISLLIAPIAMFFIVQSLIVVSDVYVLLIGTLLLACVFGFLADRIQRQADQFSRGQLENAVARACGTSLRKQAPA